MCVGSCRWVVWVGVVDCVGGLCVVCIRGGLNQTVDVTVDAVGGPLMSLLQCKAAGLQMPTQAPLCPERLL